MPMGWAGAVEGAMGTGVADEVGVGRDEGGGRSGLGPGLVGDVAGATGTRVGRAFGDRREDGDGLADADAIVTGLGDDGALACATQCSRTASAGQVGAVTETPVSFPDARQA
jgi:hypothetical protein